MRNFIHLILLLTICLYFSIDGFAQNNSPALRSKLYQVLTKPDVQNYRSVPNRTFLGNKTSVKDRYVPAEVIFSEDFDGIPGPTAGGAGTYVFPADWYLKNSDNLVPAGSVSYVNEAWERREDFSFNVTDSAAFSTSWYSPAGTADDWMISPAITLPGSGSLHWNAVAYDPQYADGYEVRISTTTQTVTGCLANPVLFSIGEENSTWTARTISLGAYAGQTIYIAFRNNSYDKFLLLIDDIVVSRVVTTDASITHDNHPFSYTQLPLIQKYPVLMNPTIRNSGTDTLHNLVAAADIYQSDNYMQTLSSDIAPILAPGQSSQMSIEPYVPTDVGPLKIIYSAAMSEIDQDPANNQDSAYINISYDELAWDDGISVSSVGIGAGNGGELGSSFETATDGYLKGVKFYMTQTIPGVPYVVNVRNFENGKPGNVIAVTDTFYTDVDSAQWIYEDLQGGILPLPADTFVVTVVEFDSTVQFGQSSTIYTDGKGWVIWPTSPFGDWANIEAFGTNFKKPFMIRPVFTEPQTVLNIDGDLSEPEYKLIGMKLNGNNGFGSEVDLTSIKFYADTASKMLFLGLEGKLPLPNNDGIGIWLNVGEQNGAPAGDSLGGIPGAGHYLGDINSPNFTADFEVDYMFALNTGGGSSNVYFDAAKIEDSLRTSQYLGSTDQLGNVTIGPAATGVFNLKKVHYAFNNSGAANKGFEIAIPFDQLGIVNDLSLQVFAFVLSNTAYFSNVTIPGNVSGSNLGFNPDFYNLPGGPWHTDTSFVSAEEQGKDITPAEFSLSQNYPNPFNPETSIKYTLAVQGKVLLKIYDILGNEVKVLVNEIKPAGSYEFKFNASHLPSGVYMYRLQAGEFSSVRKMILIK